MCVCSQEDQSIATVTEVMRRVHERRLYSVVGSIAETRPGVTFANVKVMIGKEEWTKGRTRI